MSLETPLAHIYLEANTSAGLVPSSIHFVSTKFWVSPISSILAPLKTTVTPIVCISAYTMMTPTATMLKITDHLLTLLSQHRIGKHRFRARSCT